MDLRQLRYFVGIAESGSLSAASDSLGIAQPSLSQHVMRVEQELGVQLLVRSPRGITLTDAGQRLYDHARTILRAVEGAVSDLRDHAKVPTGAVSFAFPSSVSNVLTVPLVETVRHEYPEITLRAMDAMSGTVQTWLAEGSIDFGVLYDVNSVRHLHLRPLLTEDMYLVAASDSWQGTIGPDGIAEKSVTLEECGALDLILPHRSHGLREMIERSAQAHGVSLDVRLEIDSLPLMKALVGRASGYTILAHAAVYEEIQRRTHVLVPIREPLIRRTVYLVQNPSRQVTRAAREVERVMIEVVHELVRKKHWMGTLA